MWEKTNLALKSYKIKYALKPGFNQTGCMLHVDFGNVNVTLLPAVFSLHVIK